MQHEPRDEATEGQARNVLYAQAFLNLAGTTLAIYGWQHIAHDQLAAWQALTVASGLLTLLALRLFPRFWNERTASWLFVINLVPVCGMLWVSQAALAGLDRYWVPNEPHKLSVLTVAIMAPPRLWAGMAGIAALTGIAAMQFHELPPEARARTPQSEPMAMAAYAVFAVILLFYRVRGRQLYNQSVRLNEQARMASHLSHAFLTVRDLANTPIQTLLLDAELLKRAHPEALPIADRVEASAKRLSELNNILSRAEPNPAPRPPGSGRSRERAA